MNLLEKPLFEMFSGITFSYEKYAGAPLTWHEDLRVNTSAVRTPVPDPGPWS